MNKQRLTLIFLLACMGLLVNAQAGKLPPFTMQLVGGKIFKAENLPMGKPIVIIYFSTDCDHCTKLMKALLEQTTPLKKASVAMVTFFPLGNVSGFATQYNLKRFPNFYVGTEGNTFFLRNYYKLNELPFMALYTKNGDLVKTYNDSNGLPDLIDKLKTL